jgi:hypothetical protein
MLSTIEPANVNIEPKSQQAGEIAIIDRSVSNYRYLKTTMAGSMSAFSIASEADGVERITEILENVEGVSTLHLFAEGEEGSLKLGNTRLNLENIGNYCQQLQKWASIGNPDKEIIIYDDRVTTGDNGWLLLEWLHLLTEAKIEISSSFE